MGMQVRGSEFLPLQFVKRWLTFRAPDDEFSCDNNSDYVLDDASHEIREDNGSTEIPESHDAQSRGCTDVSEPQPDEFCNAAELPLKNSLLGMRPETCHQQLVNDHEYRIVVGSWNVAGMLPPDDIDLQEWLDTTQPADIYVIGFQEIVPLIAWNVVCVEDEAPVPIWEGLIHHTLNKKMQVCNANGSVENYREPHCDEWIPQVPEVSGTDKNFLNTVMVGEDELSPLLPPEQCLPNARTQMNYLTFQQKMSGLENATLLAQMEEDLPSEECSTDTTTEDTKESLSFAPSVSATHATFSSPHRQNQFLRIVSKQMVGIFITIWIRSDLWRHVHDIKVCSVGCGIFNYLGNKGAVSVSLCLHQTSFCFVCTHLKSGHEEGDELRRNADVAEILRRTTFPQITKHPGIKLPKTIMTHDRIIWFGDLNYRVDAPDEETWELVNQGAWESLLLRDQLKLEQRAGHVLVGWHEKPICFPPTYKFIINSDEYFGKESPLGTKRRTPAWCDRILWYGKGLRQLKYKRTESQLSDHRPVSSTFMAEVEVANCEKLERA
ncbi:unnamed protein product [Sphagnum jensenii]|uniref:Inositol polyphosphate-related phosphatase domain-containing protein n=1 Tax=Sphagnum jensenii TaxID=128206 RepID=A0ABP1BLN7_9BRYO